MRIDAALHPAPVSGDPRLAEIAVSNLLENAISYNVPGGYVAVETDVGESGARLAVRNTGPRVPADQLERLKQPFQRLAGDRDHTNGGLGLGLSIVTAIVFAHGAALSLQPQPGGGLTAAVTFP